MKCLGRLSGFRKVQVTGNIERNGLKRFNGWCRSQGCYGRMREGVRTTFSCLDAYRGDQHDCMWMRFTDGGQVISWVMVKDR